jgi:hypothetical protein
VGRGGADGFIFCDTVVHDDDDDDDVDVDS